MVSTPDYRKSIHFEHKSTVMLADGHSDYFPHANLTLSMYCGVQFTEPLQSIEELITNTKEKKQSIFLPNIIKIIGFTAFLAYCILRIFFGLKPVREAFDFFIIGCGLISFAHINRIITKNFKIRS